MIHKEIKKLYTHMMILGLAGPDAQNRLFKDFREKNYSTVTDLAKFLGLSISQPFSKAT